MAVPLRTSPLAELRVSRLLASHDDILVFAWSEAAVDLMSKLTGAEESVAKMILEGLSNAEIARRRGTSARTVANQCAAIFRKLDVSSRGELVARLTRHARESRAR